MGTVESLLQKTIENVPKTLAKIHVQKITNSILKTPRVFPSLIMLNYALWGGSHASGASFLHNFANFFAKLRQNCKIRAPKKGKIENRLSPTHALGVPRGA